MIEQLRSREFDVLVVGGGITGCGIALDAATRGLCTALVERDDFASGTSSKSSKLVHGGLRYLQQGDVRLVYQALHERQRLLHNAPHLVQVLPFLNPSHAQAFDARRWPRERDVYNAAIEMLSVLSTYSRPQAQVFLWYCSSQTSLMSIASTVLLSTLQQPFSPEPAGCDGSIGEHERAQLVEHPVGYVLMLDENGKNFDVRDASLQREGYGTSEVLTRRIGGDAYRADLRLVRISKP